jgi:hypothetical protein
MTTRQTVGCVLGASAHHLLVRLYTKTAQLAPAPPSRAMMPHQTVSGAKNASTLPCQERGVQTRVGSMNQANTLFQSFHSANNYEATATQATVTAMTT